jgi:hypothetical protein
MNISIAISATEALQKDLRTRSSELLEMEQRALGLRRGQGTPLVLIDWAEDIGRAITVHAEEQIRLVETELDAARRQLDWVAENNLEGPDEAVAALRTINRASHEVSMTIGSLIAASRALRPTAQAVANDPNVSEIALRSVSTAISEVEKAQRTVFRLTEELPDVKRLITRAEEIEMFGPQVDIPPESEETVGLRAERREIPSMAADTRGRPIPGM